MRTRSDQDRGSFRNSGTTRTPDWTIKIVKIYDQFGPIGPWTSGLTFTLFSSMIFDLISKDIRIMIIIIIHHHFMVLIKLKSLQKIKLVFSKFSQFHFSQFWNNFKCQSRTESKVEDESTNQIDVWQIGTILGQLSPTIPDTKLIKCQGSADSQGRNDSFTDWTKLRAIK